MLAMMNPMLRMLSVLISRAIVKLTNGTSGPIAK